MIKSLSLLFLLLLLSACSTQPDWLQRKRQYHGWEYSTRQVHDYSFDWHISGAAYASPQQVFSASDELWVQWPAERELPVIVGIDHAGRRQVLSYHRQLPYLVIKDHWPILQFNLAGEQAYASFNLDR
ncbi:MULTISPECIES: hypothetical protein [Oligella]|uniref:Lipoprotein n=1 Tax=Oligella urethralis TaxID=90245 RepID=A0A2N6QGQ8_9BURK|nr:MULTISPECIES: hypothetical protein [Oligella]MDK6203345.1 hypothetical protein [Oligella urethralis]OFS88792.1 hypothetical protein HMPREF3144_01355 [Oligella sp. HMSC05A10]PMC18700.1 hypothetical protein CJ230_02275 [Oligella urethralis]SPY07136.1 Uncharacterised protein [Oligella urethralis]